MLSAVVDRDVIEKLWLIQIMSERTAGEIKKPPRETGVTYFFGVRFGFLNFMLTVTVTISSFISYYYPTRG